MRPLQKLSAIAHATCLEADEAPRGTRVQAQPEQSASDWALHPPWRSREKGFALQREGQHIPIHHAIAPGGKRVPLLKSMLTTACEMDCLYCPFRAGRGQRRLSFKPQELARIFQALHHDGAVQGLFLSTGILDGGVRTQDQLLDTAEILRRRMGYYGYLHIKIMPGSEKDQLLRAMQLADRVSINLEAPNATRLARLAPSKRFNEQLLLPFFWMREIRAQQDAHSAWRGRWASSTTQFVVGAAGESDLEILSTVNRLQHIPGFQRAYFKAFHPIKDTPMESQAAQDPRRQDRLYQATFLMRDYGFDLEELGFEADGNLSLTQDPKERYAQQTLMQAPLEVNHAEQHELLRIPGIGPQAANAILGARRQTRLSDLSQLQRLGILAEKAAPYITLNGQRPPRQLKLLE